MIKKVEQYDSLSIMWDNPIQQMSKFKEDIFYSSTSMFLNLGPAGQPYTLSKDPLLFT